MCATTASTPTPSVKGGACNSSASSDCYGYPLSGAQPRRERSRGGVRAALPPALHTDTTATQYATSSATAHPSALAGGWASGGAAASGLVYSQTSQNTICTAHTKTRIDRTASRLAKLKGGTITAARLHQEQSTQGGFRGRWAFVTLTYRGVDDWGPRHIASFLDHVRKWAGRKGFHCRYVWVAELQKRGAMHYHALIWLPRGISLPKPDKQGWWPHGMTKVEWARNPVGYMAKYASKGDGPCKFPKGARLHGCGGLTGAHLQEARYWRRPEWLRVQTEIAQAIRRRSGGGWIDLETGEQYESPWEVTLEHGSVWISRKAGGEVQGEGR